VTKADASTTNWVIAGSWASMSLNILANTGTTIQSMRVTAAMATKIRIIGYIIAPLTFFLVSRASRICLLSSTRTSAILPVTSPVRIASSQANSKNFGNPAAAAWRVLPAATLIAICSRTALNLMLSHWTVASFSDCSRGVPELTSVDS
jgi:hypothetical protein